MSAFLPLAFALPILAIDLAILFAGVVLVTGAVALVKARKHLKTMKKQRAAQRA